MFATPGKNIPALKKEFSDFTVVGEILPKDHGISILKEGRRQEMEKG